MKKLHLLGGIMIAGFAGGLGACSDDSSTTSEPSTPALEAATFDALATGGVRVRCERRSDRSKISVDGRNLNPRAGLYRARVRAAGGTVTSGTRRAVRGEAEFDFDSNTGEGGTRIARGFIRARSGPDVVGEILTAGGQVVASRGVECEAK